MTSAESYVIVTPARNEIAFLERTIQSVIAQSLPPQEWIVVSDGSTDGTDELVQRFAAQYSFIRLVRLEHDGKTRSFGSKVTAFNAGRAALRTADYSYIGNLDADVSFDADYFRDLMTIFGNTPKLGVAGGLVLDWSAGQFRPQRVHRNSVAGAVQMFRRECFEAIGGYVPMPRGGIDAAAEITARSLGWRVETFPQLRVLHHRPVMTGGKSVLRTRFRQGMNHRSLGYHPAFQLFFSAYQFGERPFLVGGLAMSAGYWWASLRGQATVLPPSVVAHLHREQLTRIRSLGAEWGSRATQS